MEGSGLTCPILVVEVVEDRPPKLGFSSSRVVAFSRGLQLPPTLCVYTLGRMGCDTPRFRPPRFNGTDPPRF